MAQPKIEIRQIIKEGGNWYQAVRFGGCNHPERALRHPSNSSSSRPMSRPTHSSRPTAMQCRLIATGQA